MILFIYINKEIGLDFSLHMTDSFNIISKVSMGYYALQYYQGELES